MTHPRAAFGVTPSRWRQQWPGQAGSTLALSTTFPRFTAHVHSHPMVKEF